MDKRLFYPLIVLFILAGASLSCSILSTGEKTATTAPKSPGSLGTPTPPQGASSQSDPQKMAETFFARINQQDTETAMKMFCLSVARDSTTVQHMFDMEHIVQNGQPILYKTRGVEKSNILGTTYTQVYLALSPVTGFLWGTGQVTIQEAIVSVRQTDGKWCIDDITYR